MERLRKIVTWLLFAVGVCAGAMHLGALVLRITMPVEQVAVVDLYGPLLKGVGSMWERTQVFMLRNTVRLGIVSQVALLCWQVLSTFGDYLYYKRYMTVSNQTQARLLRHARWTAYLLMDRGIPIILMLWSVGVAIDLGLLIPPVQALETIITRRALVLPSLAIAWIGWLLLLVLSLIISYITHRYFMARALDTFLAVERTEQLDERLPIGPTGQDVP